MDKQIKKINSNAKSNSGININFTYNRDPDVEFTARLAKINIDEEAKHDMSIRNGFRITTSDGTKKDLKSSTSIYSDKFGYTLHSETPYVTRYTCECGKTMGRKYLDTYCQHCKSRVKRIHDKLDYFGYIQLDEHYVIHPVMYSQISQFLRKETFQNIIQYDVKKDEDGNIISVEPDKNNPYEGLGLIKFKEKFDEIMEFYRPKRKDKAELYEDIMAHRDIIFTKSIPVYTIHLRPIKAEGGYFDHDSANRHYSMMAKNAVLINKLKGEDRNEQRILSHLYNMQLNYMELYDYVIKNLSGKKGEIRSVFSGRYNFTARAVIVPRVGRVDEVSFPYIALAEGLRQIIINVLVKSNSITPNAAASILDRANNSETSEERQLVKSIINSLIHNGERGIPILLNRNPTIEFGSSQALRIVEMNDHYCIGLPLQIIPFYSADFDGDELNAMFINNKAFEEAAFSILNPREFYISHNDGFLNKIIVHNKDLLVNINSLRMMNEYSSEQLEALRDCLR